ncbi:MAG: hypothetical protein MZU95_13860 [Desulfomicrobium escambiense]|nr:hypothetical protein [Desulfomicrobium escambiense]
MLNGQVMIAAIRNFLDDGLPLVEAVIARGQAAPAAGGRHRRGRRRRLPADGRSPPASAPRSQRPAGDRGHRRGADLDGADSAGLAGAVCGGGEASGEGDRAIKTLTGVNGAPAEVW